MSLYPGDFLRKDLLLGSGLNKGATFPEYNMSSLLPNSHLNTCDHTGSHDAEDVGAVGNALMLNLTVDKNYGQENRIKNAPTQSPEESC